MPPVKATRRPSPASCRVRDGEKSSALTAACEVDGTTSVKEGRTRRLRWGPKRMAAFLFSAGDMSAGFNPLLHFSFIKAADSSLCYRYTGRGKCSGRLIRPSLLFFLCANGRGENCLPSHIVYVSKSSLLFLVCLIERVFSYSAFNRVQFYMMDQTTAFHRTNSGFLKRI